MSAAYWALDHWGPLALSVLSIACWWAVRSIDTTGTDEHTGPDAWTVRVADCATGETLGEGLAGADGTARFSITPPQS